MIRIPPSPRGRFQNDGGLRCKNGVSQPYPAFLIFGKPSTCGFIFAAVAMVARQRFSPVNRYSCVFVAFSNTPKSPAKRKKPRQTQKARPPRWRSGFQGSVKPNLDSQTTRRLHLLGCGNANKGKHQGERHADGVASGQTGARKLGVDGTALARQHLAGSIEAVEVTGELLGKVR